MKKIFVLLFLAAFSAAFALPGDLVLESGPYKVLFAKKLLTFG